MIRKMRLEKGWSQEELAHMTGLSVRTIQRIERGHKPGLESLKSIAAVFEVDINSLQADEIMKDTNKHAQGCDTEAEKEAIEYVRDIKSFYSNLMSYVAVMLLLLVINLFTSPGNLWVIWPALGWGIGILVHAVGVFEIFDFFGPGWERKQIEKRLRKRS